MLMRYLGAILICMTLVTSTTRAETGQFVSGNKLYEWCSKSTGTNYYSVCIGYIIGVWDAQPATEFYRILWETTMRTRSKRKNVRVKSLICAPKGLIIGQIQDVVLQWLRDNPKERHRPGRVVVTMAVQEAWPCPSP